MLRTGWVDVATTKRHPKTSGRQFKGGGVPASLTYHRHRGKHHDMICYVVSFCLCHWLTPPYARGDFPYAACVEVLLTPPAYATLRAWSSFLRTGRYDTSLTKHVQGGFGRRSCFLAALKETSLGEISLQRSRHNAHTQFVHSNSFLESRCPWLLTQKGGCGIQENGRV